MHRRATRRRSSKRMAKRRFPSSSGPDSRRPLRIASVRFGGSRSIVRAYLTVGLAVLSAVGIAACSSSHASEANASTTTTVPAATTTVAPPKGVVSVDGQGSKTVLLPPSLTLPMIVHAQYTGTGKFVVSTVAGDASRVVVSSNGAYEGTFPVGFVETKAGSTVFSTKALLIEATGPWHLDSRQRRWHRVCLIRVWADSETRCSRIRDRRRASE